MRSSATTTKRRKPTRRRAELAAVAVESKSEPARNAPNPPLPYLLDFFPLEDSRYTGLTPFYDALREGRWVTTRCPRDGRWLWPPRLVCPHCHAEVLDWADLPKEGHLYAFSAVLAGAPLGMEADVPFVVGLVDLEGVALRVFGRVVGKGWMECRVGERVRVEPYELPDGRVFFRFRTVR